MGTIDEIIKAIDDELIAREKEYLLLGQANHLLVTESIITVAEQSNKVLKILLEENKIPHAYQTESTPRQWRIPLSEEGVKRKKTSKKKTPQKPNTTSYNTFSTPKNNINQPICPGCGLNLFIPPEIINENYIQCLTCGKNFRNPFKKNQNGNDIKITKTQRNWIIGIIGICVLAFYFFDQNDKAKNSNQLDEEIYSLPPQKNEVQKELNFGKYKGKVFKWKSTLNDIETSGKIETTYETIYHTFNFKNRTVTFKGQNSSGEWKSTIYPMNGYYEERGVVATTYVVIVNESGIKEIWFSPDVPNCGYDFIDGTRIACYEITKVKLDK